MALSPVQLEQIRTILLKISDLPYFKNPQVEGLVRDARSMLELISPKRSIKIDESARYAMKVLSELSRDAGQEENLNLMYAANRAWRELDKANRKSALKTAEGKQDV